MVVSGGLDRAATVNSGAFQFVLGSAVSATVNPRGTQVVSSGGSETGTRRDGGFEVVYGTAGGTVISSGGAEMVVSGGLDSGATVDSGGMQFVLGSAASATLNLGATQVVSASGRASGTTINGGFEVVYGLASGTIINSGGAEGVVLGGIDRGAHVNSGGTEVVFSGGLASGAIISGGTLEVMSVGSTGSGPTSPVTFASSGGGTLLLFDSVNYGGFVAGFGQPDFIDLRDIAFSSGTTLSFTQAPGNTSGTLIVSDGTHTANIMLLGQYTTAQVTKASDGMGGTLIGDPPMSATTDIAAAGILSPHRA
jgi:autotransporter passenger strand-loop-strand repeat protein